MPPSRSRTSSRPTPSSANCYSTSTRRKRGSCVGPICLAHPLRPSCPSGRSRLLIHTSCRSHQRLPHSLSPHSPSLPLVPLSVRLTTVLLFILFFDSDQHALRVLTILGISDCISELVYCDYARPDGEFGCKPEVGFFNEVRVHSIHPCLPLCTVYLLPHC